MPHFFNNIVVVTHDELVPEHYSYDALKKALKRCDQRGYGIKRVMLGGNGRQLLVDFDTLPRKVRECFKDPRVAEHPLEPFYNTDSEAVEFYGNYRYSNGLYLIDEVKDRYITNASVLNAAIDLKDARERERLSKMGSLKGVISSICADVTTFNEILYSRYKLRHSLPENERRFAEKFNDYQKEGYPSLINKNLGNRNAAVANDETVQLLNNIFAEPSYKPTYTEVARQYDAFLSGYIQVINTNTAEEYDPAAFKKLSKSTIYNYLSSWENRIATHTVRSADRQKNMGKYKPAFSFEQPKYAGSLLSIDDRQPPFKYSGNERVWFYLAEDVASQAVTCWVHGKTKEGLIIDFYRQLVRNYHEWGLNLPAELEAESNQNASFKETFLKEGAMFQYVRIEANNARGKAIESQVNRQLRYQFEKMEAGWQGRPFAQDESNQPSPTRDKIDRTYTQIVDMALGKIEEFNNSPHVREANVSKWEYFLQNQNPDLKPTNYRSFIRHLGYHTETSVNVGNIRLNNEIYLLGIDGEIALGDSLINIMKQVEGKEVDIYWLDANEGTMLCAYVYLRGQDRLICEAVPKPKPQRARAEQSEADRQLHLLYSKYVATVEGYNNRQRKTLDSVIAIKTDKQPETSPKTLFKINGNGAPITPTQEDDPIKLNGHHFDDVEILPEPTDNDIDLINIETPFNRSLKDRF
jgi:hypothetical protein